MKLYVLESKDSQSFWGLPHEPTPQEGAVIVAQRPDCSGFLLLSTKPHAALSECKAVPDGFDFTYCQAWGLTVNQAVLERVITDLRVKAYPPIGDYLDMVVKGDEKAIDKYKLNCLGVKAKYPKLDLG